MCFCFPYFGLSDTEISLGLETFSPEMPVEDDFKTVCLRHVDKTQTRD